MQKFKIIGKPFLGEKYVSACCPPRNNDLRGEGGAEVPILEKNSKNNSDHTLKLLDGYKNNKPVVSSFSLMF